MIFSSEELKSWSTVFSLDSLCELLWNAESLLPQSAECLVVSQREPACLPANLPAAAGSGWLAAACPAAAPEGSQRSCTQLDNEQGDKVELWPSYHPEPPGHTALLVVTKPSSLGKLTAWLGRQANTPVGLFMTSERRGICWFLL